MNFYQHLIRHHVLANLLFILVLVIGFLSYQSLPRQQDPTINFNWIVITTILPGASALDVEKRLTDPLEDALRQIQNINFISSNSRDNISSMLIRFEDIDTYTFDKRVTELRREIQNTRDKLPATAENSLIWEITSGNAFPTATIAIQGISNDENLRQQSVHIKKDIEKIVGVHRVDTIGMHNPEIHIDFSPSQLEAASLTPLQLQQTIQAYFNDNALGQLKIGKQNWLIRLLGSEVEPSKISHWPIQGNQVYSPQSSSANSTSTNNNQYTQLTLGHLANITLSTTKADQLALHDGNPAIILTVMKQDNANNIELVEKVKKYIDKRNQLNQSGNQNKSIDKTKQGGSSAIKLSLIDDQTVATQEAISLMQNNAIIGLFFVLLVTFIFLGSKIAILTVIGIPFILAGTFWILAGMGETLNVTVLLAVVIVLGMLVDDAVVIVEAISYRIERGEEVIIAASNALNEIALPVTTAVLTTMAAFLPLMLLPGILGDFMRVIPMVVSLALLLSLVEAFWMLPSHIVQAKVNFSKPSRIHELRKKFKHHLQIAYVRKLAFALRHPIISFTLIILLMLGSVAAIISGQIKMNFFAADNLRLFYINIEMPSDTTLTTTLKTVSTIEKRIKQTIKPGEVRQIISYAGLMYTEMEPLKGEQYGQILVGLNPKKESLRGVVEMIDAMRETAENISGPINVSFLKLAGGPPIAKPISIKVRGNQYAQIQEAVTILKRIMSEQVSIPQANSSLPEETLNESKPNISSSDYIDISDDATQGKMELQLQLNKLEITRLGLRADEIQQTLQLLIDGQIISSIRHDGEKINIRLQATKNNIRDIDELLSFRLLLNNGHSVPLSQILIQTRKVSLGNIRHYNFRRAITLEANLKANGMNTIDANQYIVDQWKKHQHKYPDIDLDFTGELDDIQNSMDAIGLLFIFGIGLMYLLLGTQFKSYWQPLMILSTVLMAFTGVIIGLVLSSNPLSLYTLYGIVALAGIAVNASIVLISAANMRQQQGMSLLHSTIYAARRRVIPILITSMTTIAGLLSLATGLGGHSLIWGPVATAIVWGLFFSTILTLFVIPLLYWTFMPSNVKHH